MTALRTAQNPHEIGARLAALLKAMKLSQAEFARLTGVSQQALNNWLQGRQRPSLDQALKIAAKTGATLDYIYRGDESALPAKLLKLLPPAA